MNPKAVIRFIADKLKDPVLLNEEFARARTLTVKESKKRQMCGNSAESLGRNRHAILPFSFNAVKVGGQYINASYIKDDFSPKRYIATQAPIPDTMNDFWNMVLEEQCQCIIMLGEYSEGENIKIDRYFPEELNGTILFENVEVCLKSYSSTEYIQTRKFEVRSLITRETHLVVHNHFESWPDFGTQDNFSAMREVILTMDKHRGISPIIVHCSAGVGRTGTLIAIDLLVRRLLRHAQMQSSPEWLNMHKICPITLNRMSLPLNLSCGCRRTPTDLASGKTIADVERCVHQLRGQRWPMVMNIAQYGMVYKFLYSVIKGSIQMSRMARTKEPGRVAADSSFESKPRPRSESKRVVPVRSEPRRDESEKESGTSTEDYALMTRKLQMLQSQ
eukprot:TRINITY_DN779940_c0_g1_i1.p1 TRINITY_DN779940_c0_g1~~TRINITY_DN779940_c0_g1_i1.p1  ORF type:complete len:390 (+),score=67.89 TRINITY_DN779940_c0_g1_i1:113-1282(+)